MTRQWSRGEKWLFIGTGIFCLPLLVGSWVYERQNELPPPPPQITKVPPTNNALDLVVRAVAALPPMPPSLIPAKGNKLTGFDDGISGASRDYPAPYTPEYNKAFPLAKKLSYLKSSQATLALWRQSLALPLYVPLGNDALKELSRAQLDGWNKRHRLITVTYIQARACWQRGDNTSALKWLLAVHRFACCEATFFYNGQTHPSDHYAFYSSVRKRQNIATEIGRLMPYLSNSQLRYAVREMEQNCALVPSLVEALKVTLDRNMSRRYQWCARNDLRLSDNEEHPEQSEISNSEQLRFRWTNKKRVLEQLRKQCDWLVAQAETPVSRRAILYPDSIAFKYDEPLHRIGLDNFASWFVDIEKAQAQELVLLTAMAARAFQLEQGHAPRALSELMPNYLQKIENDPCCPTQPLCYSSQTKTYTQWFSGGPVYATQKTIKTTPLSASAPAGVSVAPIIGYQVASKVQTLPFLLYSVGATGQDDGGMDFQSMGRDPNSASPGPGSFKFCDDIPAPVEWFQLPTQIKWKILPSSAFLATP